MNEQINQLYQQALEFVYKNVNKEIWNTDNFHAIVAGKFAELIVRECLKQIKDGMVDESELLYEHEETTECVNEALMDAHHNIAIHFGFAEHFGVEE